MEIQNLLYRFETPRIHFDFNFIQEWKQSLSKLEAKIESGEEGNEQIQKRKQELEQAIERYINCCVC